MMNLLEILAAFTQWLFITSLKGTLLIGIILLVRWILRDRLSARWQHALWFLLILRLVFPFSIPSPLSVFNVTEKAARPTLAPVRSIFLADAAESAFSPSQEPANNPSSSGQGIQAVYSANSELTVLQGLSLVWTVVLIGLLFSMCICNLRLFLRLRNAEPMFDERLQTILTRCRKKLRIRHPISVYSLAGTQTPFWFGIFSPRIYFPTNLTDQFSEEDLEHILLHELAHYKRLDLPVALLQSLLQVFYWFNPVIWLAFIQMRADRETACDEFALNIIGSSKSQHYGNTLIQLLRNSSKRKLMPMTIGLADGRENLKRRIKMIANFSNRSKWWTVLVALLLIVISTVTLTSAQKNQTLSGQVSFAGQLIPDTTYVAVYDYNWENRFFGSGGEPLHFSTLTKQKKFKFPAEPGLYTLVAWGAGYEAGQVRIFIESPESKLKVAMNLEPCGIFEEIGHVALFGDFCGWDQSKAVQMQEVNGVWQIDPPENMKIGQKYKFMIWEDEVTGFGEFLLDPTKVLLVQYSPNAGRLIPSINWGTFDQVYEGETLVFDPGLFQRPRKNATIKVKGWELAPQFDQLKEELYMWTLKMVKPLNAKDKSMDRVAHYYQMRKELETIENKYDPVFEPFFTENKLYLYQLLDPVRQKAYQLHREDSLSEKAAFFEGEEFEKHFKDRVALIRKLDPSDWFHQGELVYNCLISIPRYLEMWPALKEKYSISRTECLQILDDFAARAISPSCRENILLYLSRRYADMDSTELSEKYKTMLSEQFPNSWAIKSLNTKRDYSSWEDVTPYPAKSLTLTTVEGDHISLADFKGKFVFLDFWGTWCRPCREEQPHLIQMCKLIPKDKFQILGLVVGDEEETLQKYLKKHSLPYPNALVDKEVGKQWDVKSVPTTLLIDPKGNVVAKNIRGSEMVARMKQTIDTYFNDG